MSRFLVLIYEDEQKWIDMAEGAQQALEAHYAFNMTRADIWGRDGAEVIDWAARQAWSDGNVGMLGFSFTGTSQIATAAYAGPALDRPQVVVHFADLDLSRSQGAAVLYRRLKAAAETVCAPLDDRELGRHLRFKACAQSALSRAVAEVDRPALTEYYRARAGSSS